MSRGTSTATTSSGRRVQASRAPPRVTCTRPLSQYLKLFIVSAIITLHDVLHVASRVIIRAQEFGRHAGQLLQRVLIGRGPPGLAGQSHLPLGSGSLPSRHVAPTIPSGVHFAVSSVRFLASRFQFPDYVLHLRPSIDFGKSLAMTLVDLAAFGHLFSMNLVTLS